MRCIWRDHKCRGVRDQADLAHGTHAFVRGEVIEHRERLHGERQSDAAFEARLEIGDSAAFAADHAIVVAVQESDQPDTGGARLFRHLHRCHQADDWAACDRRLGPRK